MGVLAIATGYVVIPALSLFAQEPPVYRSTADLVVVQAVAFSSGGGPVVDLDKDDFRIFENGKERPVSVFIGPRSGPMEIALLIDASSSMRRWPTKEATKAFLESLHPGSCVLFLPFNDRLHIGVWGHPGDERIRERLADLELDGGTAIYDALLGAFSAMRSRGAAAGGNPTTGVESMTFGQLQRFRMPGIAQATTSAEGECAVQRLPWSEPKEAERVRRAVVVVTDGQDNKSQAKIDDVLVAAWGSGLPVFAFAATERPRGGDQTMVGEPTRLGHVRDLRRVAEYTGGLVFRETMEDWSGRDFWKGFRRLSAGLRAHYVLGYVPDETEPATIADRRKIKVEVRRPGIDVMAPRDVVLGRGASQGAALDWSLRGFQILAAGDAASALHAFDTAASLSPELGLVEYGRGLAYSGLARPEDALASFERAAALAPWMPDLDAHVAEAALEQESFDTAWEHALRAYSRGSEVLDLIDRLQQVAPRAIDLETILPEVPRVGLQASGQGALLGAVVAPAVLATLGNAILASPRLTLAETGFEPDLFLLMDVRKVERHGPRVSLIGWMVLKRRSGEELDEFSFKLDDVRSEAELRSIAERTLSWIDRVLGR